VEVGMKSDNVDGTICAGTHTAARGAMNAEGLARALGGRHSGGQWHARCPAHDDRTPSLSFCDADDGRVLFYCHAGCRQAEVIAALRRLDLWEGELAPQPARQPMPNPTRDDISERRAKAQWLWGKRQPIIGSCAETYLRNHRGIMCPLPATLGLLPANERHPPTMIAAFGMAHEIEPGVVAISDDAVTATHLTRLTPQGEKHPETPNKIIIGSPAGAPIMLASMNDLLGLVVTEGIEDALSMHEATGLGAWAAGSANRMPALADAVPDHTDCVTVCEDADKAGHDNAALLAERLIARGVFAEVVPSAGSAP
jgi:hypothetical protein